MEKISFIPNWVRDVKLKTVKDLKLERADTRINDILKAEAVKWVKAREGWKITENSIDWIKHLFNLTEEDLR